jgi:hypothetical protein
VTSRKSRQARFPSSFNNESPAKGPTMLQSRFLSKVLIPVGILSVGIGCSSGGTETKTITVPNPMGGTPGAGGSGTGGAGVTTGGGGAGPTAGSAPVGGSTSGGSGGSVAVGGSGGSGDSGGSAGSGGGGGSGGTGEDPNKVVLFDGSDASFNAWRSRNGGGANPWTKNADGSMTVKTGTGDIQSTQTFNSVFVHVEYMTPVLTSDSMGQERGNSGVYLKGAYEMQILDGFGTSPATNGCGAIYGVSAPIVVACKEAEQWNTYEAEFVAQECDGDTKTAPARFVEVKLNGTLVQQNVTVNGSTQGGLPESCEPRGLLLQDHSSTLPVKYKNIWVIPRD